MLECFDFLVDSFYKSEERFSSKRRTAGDAQNYGGWKTVWYIFTFKRPDNRNQ